jgi:hypothetical protein
MDHFNVEEHLFEKRLVLERVGSVVELPMPNWVVMKRRGAY